jgi:type IV pilus assembly protein PilE
LMIVAILLALAYPSYAQYARKAKRGEAQQLLMNWAINQEIFRSNHTEYAKSGTDDAILPNPVHQDGHYVFNDYGAMGTEATCTGGSGKPTAIGYWLEAVAQVDQTNDVARDGTSCTTLCMSSIGIKHPTACWE